MMQTIEQQHDKLIEKIRRIEVSNDELDYWLDNKVTQRFMLEIELAMLIALQPVDYDGPTDDVGNTALRFNWSKGMVEAFDMVLTWQPEDFVTH